MRAEATAVRKYLLFAAAIVAFLAVRFAAESWFEIPSPVSAALGFFVMGVIIKPLAAPDLPMSRWLIVPLAGTAIALVILSAPRWYERWAETVPAFLPTEDQFEALVMYTAEGPGARETPIDCGAYGSSPDWTPAQQCATEALDAGEAFYFFFPPVGWETGNSRQALASGGRGFTQLLNFFVDRTRVPPYSGIYLSPCRDPRFLEGERRPYVQCGPWPTRYEFAQEVRVGTACGNHQAMSDSASSRTLDQIECVNAALGSGDAFHFTFETDWGGGYGVVDGALSWQADGEAPPTLSYYLRDDQTDDAEPRLIQRDCHAPTVRVGPALSAADDRYRRSSVEVHCGGGADLLR